MKKFKILAGIWLLVLLVILTSYIIVSYSGHDKIWLHVFSNGLYAYNFDTIVYVQARNLDNGSVFNNWSVRTMWVDMDNHSNLSNPVVTPLSKDGSCIAKLPRINGYTDPIVQKHRGKALILIELMNDKGNTVRSSYLEMYDSRGLRPQEEEPDYNQPLLTMDAPSAFLIDQPNEVRILAFENGKPYEGTIEIEQVNGHDAKFPAQVEADQSGITSIEVTLNYSADLKITAGNTTSYASFFVNELPFHAHIDDPNLTPSHQPELEFIPMGTVKMIYIDYFYRGAWIDRKSYNLESDEHILLNPNLGGLKLERYPQVIFARISESPLPISNSTQTFALYGHIDDGRINTFTFIEFVHGSEKIQSVTATDAAYYIWNFAHSLQDDPHNHPKDILKQLRNEYLWLLARSHEDPNITIKIKTEEQRAAAHEKNKSDHKSNTNPILIAWLLLGMAGYGAFCLVEILRQRKEMMTLDPSLDSGSPIKYQFTSGLLFAGFLLILVLFGLLYYMMQLL